MLQMQELYEKVSKDESLQEKYAEIIKAEKSREETEKELINFAKDEGFDVTMEDIKAFFKELSEKKEGAISEAELDMVAGGKGGSTDNLSLKTLIYGCVVTSGTQEANGGKCMYL